MAKYYGILIVQLILLVSSWTNMISVSHDFVLISVQSVLVFLALILLTLDILKKKRTKILFKILSVCASVVLFVVNYIILGLASAYGS